MLHSALQLPASFKEPGSEKNQKVFKQFEVDSLQVAHQLVAGVVEKKEEPPKEAWGKLVVFVCFLVGLLAEEGFSIVEELHSGPPLGPTESQGGPQRKSHEQSWKGRIVN